jgi:hypothetical protein
MRAAWLFSLAAIAAGGCAPRSSAAGSASAAVQTTAEGVVYLVGGEPAVQLMLRPAAGAPMQLLGELQLELRRLSGATVEVRGTPAPPRGAPGEALTVSEYTVLGIDGQRPRVGVLAVHGGTVWLRDRDSVALADPQGRLGRLAGAKVWVVTDGSAMPASVTSFGVLRESQ